MSKKKINFSQQRPNLSRQVPGLVDSPLLFELTSSYPELARIRFTPTDSELDEQVVQTEEKVRA